MINNVTSALARVAQLFGESVPSQGGFNPWLGCVQEVTDLFLSHIDVSLSPSPLFQ